MPNASVIKTLEYVQCGIPVERATANMTTGLDLFTIAGGRVLIPLILGEVTTIQEATASAVKLQANPTVGTTNDLCGAVEWNAAEAGTLITIPGATAGTMILGKSGCAKGQDVPVIVATGTIAINMVAAMTGSVKWKLWYIPLDDGATVVAT